MAEELELQYDEDKAIKFIRGYMPAEIALRYSDDEILNIIDMIWDYYEEHGLLELPEPTDVSSQAEGEAAKADIMAYVKRMLAKDKLAVVDTEHVSYIVDGELAYEKSIGLE